MLDRAAALVRERVEDLARTIAAEAGKPLKTATVEAQRCVDTLTFSAVEARKLTGGTVPMEASAGGVGKLGVMLRVPYGVVGAISPFNFPLNLVAHKLGPAIAAGNAVVLKPAGQTPITAMKLVEILNEAGLPEGWLNVVPGSGSEVGNAIVEHPLVGAITFTGSAPVGWGIRSKAPHKKVNLELGSQRAADRQRRRRLGSGRRQGPDPRLRPRRPGLHLDPADPRARGDRRPLHRAAACKNIEGLVVGDPLDPDTDVGPLITPGDRDRVKEWVDEAVSAGAELLVGGELVDEGRCLAPTLLARRAERREGLVRGGLRAGGHDRHLRRLRAGLAMANDSKFGLQAGVFTRDLGRAIEAGKTLEFGGIMVNEVPAFRADQMPYGGVKDSGNTREGPAFAVYELTEERFVTLQG